MRFRVHPDPKSVLLLVATVTVFASSLVGAEFLLRFVSPNYLSELHADESSTVYSETYGWELRRGFHALDFGRLATINGRGYRGKEHPYQKPQGRVRVVMVGDSIGYGAGATDDEMFSALLESRSPRFDVVNLSVGGYGTDQELIELESEGLRYGPDVVILNFCLFSDFMDNALASGLFDPRQPKPYFTRDGDRLVLHDQHLKLSRVRRFTQWLSDYSHLYNRLRVLIGLRRPPRTPGAWNRQMKLALKQLAMSEDLTFRLIRQMDEVSRKAGARFLVLVHPDKTAYENPASPLLRLFCTTPLLSGITVVEMGQRYTAKGFQFGQITLDAPGHLNPLGHELATQVIEDALTKPLPQDGTIAHPVAAAEARQRPRPRTGPRAGAPRLPGPHSRGHGLGCSRNRPASAATSHGVGEPGRGVSFSRHRTLSF